MDYKFLSISSFIKSVLLLLACTTQSKCDDTSGPRQSSCIQTVDPNAPNCTLVFRNEGETEVFYNATCVQPNTIVVPYRIRPRTTNTEDSIYFSVLFDNSPPPYAKINCKSAYPTDFEFDGVGALDFFRVWKGQQPFINENDTTRAFNLNTEILLTPEATGRYTFYAIGNKSLSTSFFIFAEASSKPYLLGATASRTHTLKPLKPIPNGRPSDGTMVLPCITSNYNTSLNLYMRMAQDKWFKVESQAARRDPKQGFIMSNVLGIYKCSTGNEYDSDSVIVEIQETPDTVAAGIKPGSTSLFLTIFNDTAICISSNINSTLNSSIELTNIYSKNPTESRLLSECLIKGNSYCGSHSYHQRKVADVNEIDSTCLKPSCAQITGIHPTGLLFCSQGSDYIAQEYFTGLDSKIYTDWKTAPSNAIIRPKWTPNPNPNSLPVFQTGTGYDFHCESVGFLFPKDPYLISAKLLNGSLVQMTEIEFWLSSKSLYLTPHMEEIICSHKLWATNEIAMSSIKPTIRERHCLQDQFKCNNFQCIRDTWRCDGDNDCQDSTDEHDCLHHTCKAGHYQCGSGFCIPIEKKCNNKWDCADRSDELNSTCLDTRCSQQEFKCASGQCMPAHFLCDGDFDCLDESDESTESCQKYHPAIVNSSVRTTVKFLPNTMTELICEIGLLPDRLQPHVEWYFNQVNITDSNRLWKDITGLKLALRFPNVSTADVGQYKCTATNSLGYNEYYVNVTLVEPDTSCTSDLDYHSCLLRKCYFNHARSVCLTEAEFHKSTSTSTTTTTTRSTTTTSTTTVATLISTSTMSTERPMPSSTSRMATMPSDQSSSSLSSNRGFNGSILGVSLIILLVVIAAIGGAFTGWKYYTRKRDATSNSCSVRLREDEQVVLINVGS